MLPHAPVAVVSLLAVAATTLTLPAGDGRPVPASWHGASDASDVARAPVVVLLAEGGRSRADWKKTTAELNAAGFSVLAIEPRKLGPKESFGVGVADVAAALKWLGGRQDVNVQRVLVAGAGDGAMIALAAAASDVSGIEIAGLALLSPSLDADRLDDVTALADYGPRPFFVAVSKGDKRTSQSALVLDGNAQGPKKMHISDGSRKGTELLSHDAASLRAFVDWAKKAGGLTGETSP